MFLVCGVSRFVPGLVARVGVAGLRGVGACVGRIFYCSNGARGGEPCIKQRRVGRGLINIVFSFSTTSMLYTRCPTPLPTTPQKNVAGFIPRAASRHNPSWSSKCGNPNFSCSPKGSTDSAAGAAPAPPGSSPAGASPSSTVCE